MAHNSWAGHPGDNGNDSSKRDSLSVAASRPADMVCLLDFLLNDWKDRAAIDRVRVGLFGFSMGGYTGLVLAGGNPDFRRIAPAARSRIRRELASSFAAATFRPTRRTMRGSAPL
jgi:predicted dienelactone hydrolase